MSHQKKITPSWQIKFKSWAFTFSIKTTLLFLTLCSILIYLGSWQLERGRQKNILATLLQQRINNQPIPLSSIIAPNLIKDRFTTVTEYGTYLNEYTFLLDNQILHRQAGYRVLTIFQTTASKKLLLIDRGWIQRGKDRQNLPTINPIHGAQSVTGVINTIPFGLQLPIHIPQTPNWPLVIQALDYALISNILQQPIFNFVIQLQDNNSATYTVVPLSLGMSSSKHFAYAWQWYFFALLALGFYLFTSIERVNHFANKY